MCQLLDQTVPDTWIGKCGQIKWLLRSLDLTPLDFYLWGRLKAMVYGERIRDIKH